MTGCPLPILMAFVGDWIVLQSSTIEGQRCTGSSTILRKRLW